MFPTYLFIISFGFISWPKFSQSISPVDHYSLSSVHKSSPNLLVHIITGFHQFFPPISWVHHDVSSVLVVRSFIVFLDFISLPHQSLHCTIHFHQFSPNYLSLDFIRFPQLLVHLIIGVHHVCPSIPWFYHEISISFPHLFVHFLTRFHQVSPPGSFNRWFLLVFSISSFLLFADLIIFPSYCNVGSMHYFPISPEFQVSIYIFEYICKKPTYVYLYLYICFLYLHTNNHKYIDGWMT